MSDTSVGTAHGAIEIDLSGLHAAVQRSHSLMSQMEQSISRAGAASDQAARQLSGMGDILIGVAQGAGQALAHAMANVAGSIAGVGKTMIDSNAEFERYQVQFGVLLGSTEAAQKRLEELATFGATTPFELPGVVRADKILQAFGLHVDNAIQRFGKSGVEIRTIAGDVAAGTGAEFEEIAAYIGKFSTGATGEAIERFQELGIVTKHELAKMGLTFDKGGSLVINSQAELDRATGILLKAMQQKYGGMMEAQSRTFEGMMSNLEDWKNQTLRTLGAPIFDVLKAQLANVLTWLPSIDPQIEAMAKGIERALAAASPRIAGLLNRLKAAARGVAAVIDVIRTNLAGLADNGLGDTVANLVNDLARLAGLAPSRDLLTAISVAADDVAAALDAARDAVAPFVAAWNENGLAGALALANQRFPFLQEAIVNLQQAFQPLVDAVQPVLAGLSEGGLAGAFAALRDNILPILAALNDLRINLATLALDSLSALAERLSDDAGFAAFLRNLGLSNEHIAIVNRVLKTAGDLLRQVSAAVSEVAGWLQQQLLPAITNAGGEFAKMLLPHLETLGVILVEDVFPILKDVSQFLMNNLPGAINVAAPLITGLADVALSALELALRAIGQVWRETLKPAFVEIGAWLEDLTGGWNNLARGAGVVRDALGDVAKSIRDMANANPLEAALKLPGMPWFGRATAPADDAALGRFGDGLGAPQKRARGGPIRAGQPYVVGERGPELIIPATNGLVLSAAQSAALTASALPKLAGLGRGAPGMTLNVTITNPVVDNAERLNQLATQIAARAEQAMHAALTMELDALIVSGGPV